MCFKAGNDELDTVKNLMSMSLSVVVADALEVEIEDVSPKALLVEDLGMTADKAELIKEGIAEYFDGLEIDFTRVRTLQDLLDVVVLNEFRDLEKSCPVEEEFEYRMAA